MPSFAFRGTDNGGRAQQGTLEAPTASAAAATLRGRGLVILDLRAATAPTGPDDGLLAKLNPFYWMPPRSLDVEVSLQQIAVMLRSGLTLLTALKTVAEQATRPSMRKVWEDVARRIEEGSSLADAMMAHSCFPHLTVQLVRVGEQTGTLELVVTRASEAMERRRVLIFTLLTAMTYPAIVVIAAVGVASFMVVGVVPKLARFLASLGRKLPAMTQMLVDISAWVQVNGVYLVTGIVVAIVSFIALYWWPPGRLWIDRTFLRLPIVGKLMRLAATALFARSLGVLIHSGITLVEALRTVETLPRNYYVRQQIATARASILAGGRLADPLGERTAFMPMLSRMVAVGETSGTLDEILEEVAKFHEAQLQSSIRRLSTLIEPAIVVVVGGIVGFVCIAFFVALFSVAGGAR